MKQDLIVKKRGGGERRIPADKWFADRRVDVGESADLYERMPHGGKRPINRANIIRREESIQ